MALCSALFVTLETLFLVRNESLNRDLIVIQMPHEYTQDESKQTKALSSRAQAVSAAGSKDLIFQRNNVPALPKKL